MSRTDHRLRDAMRDEDRRDAEELDRPSAQPASPTSRHPGGIVGHLIDKYGPANGSDAEKARFVDLVADVQEGKDVGERAGGFGR